MALNVLIVDDSGVMRAMVKKTLGMTEISIGEIYQASNGQEGLEMLKNQWIDLVLVDINMPVMTGEEMIRRMKADVELAGIPTIVISTEGSETRIQQYEELGVKFIRKPFSPESLNDKINELIDTGAVHERED